MALKKLLSFKKPASSGSSTVQDPEDSSSAHSSSPSSHRHTHRSSSPITTTPLPNVVNTELQTSIIEPAVENSDFKSFQYSFKSNSLFSKSNYTASTLLTSRNSELSNKQEHGITSIGRLLRVLDEEEIEDQELTSVSSSDISSIMTKIDKELKILLMELNNIVLQINQSILNLTKISIKVGELFKTVIANLKDKIKNLPENYITTLNNQSLRKIIKVILYLVDNLLNDDVYTNSRALILKNFNDLLICLKLNSNDNELTNFNSVLQPKLFSIGSTDVAFPNEQKIDSIISTLLSKKTVIFDQEGSFIAPVLRGFGNVNISCITFIFGFPDLTKEHKQIINVFYSLIDDFHFTYQKNQIKLLKTTDFKAPFRIPTDMRQPPISMPISAENSTNLSGTLGGYIYPKIDSSVTNKNLQRYKGSVFGMTCAHVVLQDNISSEEEYPHVSCPSAVLINLYKRALNNERLKYKPVSEEYLAYDNFIRQIDRTFPLQDLKLSNQQLIKRNLPSTKFGQIIWGERIINHTAGKLSDLAIIKMSSDLKCLNYLGDDVNFNEFDPSLVFTNLYLKKVIDLNTLKKSNRGLVHGGGLEVFKYGSTTKFTRGSINGVKLIYWSDGTLRTSEFVIKSTDSKTGSFASGGDSGSWILSKLQDVSKYELNFVDTILNREHTETGLGVVGMLHSYDGEFKQFGLFTPMVDILDRLNDVTGLQWGVIGCDENDLVESTLSDDDIIDNSDIE